MKKTVKIFLGIVSALFLVLALAAVSTGILVATPGGQNYLLGWVNDRIPGSASLEALDFSLAEKTIEIHGLEIQDPDLKKVVTVEKLVIRLDLSRLFDHEIIFKQIQISEPRFYLNQTNNDGLNLTACFVDPDKPAESPPPTASSVPLPVNIIVEQFVVERGSLDLALESENLQVKTEDIFLSGSGNLAAKTAQVSLLTQACTLFLDHQERFRADRITLSLVLENDALSDIDLSVVSGPGTLGLKGSVTDLFKTPRTDLAMDLVADLGKVSGAMVSPIAMAGKVKTIATLIGTLNDPLINLSVTSDGGKVTSVPFMRTDLKCQLKNRVLALERFTSTIDGSKISATANADLTRAFPDGFFGNLVAEKIRATLDLAATNAGYQDLPRGNTRMALAFSDDRLEIKQFNLNVLDSNLTLKGQIKPLEKGRLLPPEKIEADLSFASTRIILEKFLERFLPGKSLRKGIIKGEFTVKGSIKGALGNPAMVLALNGRDIQPLGPPQPPSESQEKPVNKKIQAQVQLHLKEQMLTLEKVLVTLEGGQVSGEGQIDLTRALSQGFFGDVAVEKISADLKLSADHFEPQPLLSQFDIADVHGKFSFDATLTGSLDHPSVSLRLTASDAGYKDFPRTDAAMDLVFSDDYLDIKKFSLNNPDTNLFTEGRVRFMDNGRLLAPEKISGDLKVTADHFDLGPLLEQFNLPNIHGKYAFNATLTGSLGHPGASVHLMATDAGYKDFPRADAAMDFVFSNDYLDVKKVVLTNQDSSLNLDGRIRLMENGRLLAHEKMTFEADMTISQSNLRPYFDPAGTADVNGSMKATVQAKGSLEQKIEINAAGTMPARTAQLFTREITNVEGNIAIQIHAFVNPEIKKSTVTGRVELVNIAMVVDGTGQKLHKINGRILADRKTIQIENITGMLDTGHLTLSGDMGLVDFSPDRFNIKLKGKDLPVVLPDRMNSLFQTDLVLSGTLKDASLDGAITLSSGEWTADFNLEKTVLEKILGSGRNRSTTPADRSDSLVDAIKLNLLVRADAPFSISNNLADLWVTPSLMIGGTFGGPAVTGRATLTPGTITYHGKEFELTRGIVDFADPYGIAPVLDILAEHQIQDRRILLKLAGPPDNLILTLSSVPQEQYGDILSLLLTGKTTNELINSEGGTTASPASLVAGLAASSLAERLKKNVGIDTLGVGVGQGSSSSSLSDVNLTVGKEITDKITVTYGMETKEGEMVQKTSTDYKLSDRFTLSGFQNTEGHYGAEVRYRLEFQ